MLLSDSKSSECRIEGTFEDIRMELTILLANLIHYDFKPLGIDVIPFMALVTSTAMEMNDHEELFTTGRSTMMIIPRKEDGQ